MGIDLDNQDDEIYKSCPGCGKLIKWGAVVCPYCKLPCPEIEYQELRGGMTHPVFAKQNSRAPNNKRTLLIILVILLGIIISLVAFINMRSKKNAIKVPIQSINTSSTKMDIATVASETTVALTTTTVEIPTTTVKSAYIFIVGDVIVSKGTIITVNKFEKSNGDDANKIKDGMEYIIVSIKIINKNKDNISYNPTDFKMQNSKGQITGTIDNFTTLKTGKLAFDDEIEGTVVFEEPKNDSELILIYQPDFLNGKDAVQIMIK